MNKVIFASVAAVAAAACASVSDKTTIRGTFADAEFPLEVHVTVPDKVDTVFTLSSPEFKIEIPANKLGFSKMDIGPESVGFISDGTVLTVVREDGDYAVKSSTPGISVQDAYRSFSTVSREMMTTYRTRMRAIADSTSLSDIAKDRLQEEVYDNFMEKYLDFNRKAIAGNGDNILGIVALQNVYHEFSDGELDSLLNGLDPALADNDFIVKLRTGIEARKGTAEGMGFTDFTVAQPDGKEVSLSDYVGNGKYVLVDFWASWCGPCKREIPNIKAVYDKFHGEQFDVLSVAVWDEPQASVDTAKAYGVNWNEIVNAQSVPTALYGIQGIPHIILFGPDGTILKRGLRGGGIAEEVAKYVRQGAAE